MIRRISNIDEQQVFKCSRHNTNLKWYIRVWVEIDSWGSHGNGQMKLYLSGVYIFVSDISSVFAGLDWGLALWPLVGYFEPMIWLQWYQVPVLVTRNWDHCHTRPRHTVRASYLLYICVSSLTGGLPGQCTAMAHCQLAMCVCHCWLWPCIQCGPGPSTVQLLIPTRLLSDCITNITTGGNWNLRRTGHFLQLLQ